MQGGKSDPHFLKSKNNLQIAGYSLIRNANYA